MANAVDILVAYQFIKQLSKPWEDWQAFELGLIDKNGKRIRKTKSPEEKRAYPRWKVLVANIKRFLDKIPGGRTRLGSFAASLWLLKEEKNVEDIEVLEKAFEEYLETKDLLIEMEENSKQINTLDKGRYKLTETSEIFFINETNSIGTAFRKPLFEIEDNVTGKKKLVTADELEEF